MRVILDLEGQPFFNSSTALMAMQAAQMYFSLAGFCTTSHVNIRNGSIELTVHFDLPNYPTLPNGYKYSTREVTSHPYWSDTLNKMLRVRTTTFTYKF